MKAIIKFSRDTYKKTEYFSANKRLESFYQLNDELWTGIKQYKY